MTAASVSAELQARAARVENDLASANSALKSALQSGADTSAAREFLAAAIADAAAVARDISAEIALRERQFAERTAARTAELSDQALADVRARLAPFFVPPAPSGRFTMEIS